MVATDFQPYVGPAPFRRQDESRFITNPPQQQSEARQVHAQGGNGQSGPTLLIGSRNPGESIAERFFEQPLARIEHL